MKRRLAATMRATEFLSDHVSATNEKMRSAHAMVVLLAACIAMASMPVGVAQTFSPNTFATEVFATDVTRALQLSPLGAPANDHCFNAIELIPNDIDTVNGTTRNSTLQGWCAGDPEWNGVWYKVLGTGNLMSVSTCSSLTDYKTDISIQWHCECPSCIDPLNPSFAFRCDGQGGITKSWQSVANETFYLFVTGRERGTTGNFGIFVEDFEPPPNDACELALPLEINAVEPTQGTTIAARKSEWCTPTTIEEEDDDPDAPLPPIVEYPGVWYYFNGTGNHVTISTCHEDTDFNTDISLQSPSCSVKDCVKPTTMTTPCEEFDGMSITFPTKKGQNYYVFVTGQDEFDIGDFSLTIDEVYSPTNDFCKFAQVMPVNKANITGTTVAATRDRSCGSLQATKTGVWFSINGTGNLMAIDTCNVKTNFVTKVDIHTSCASSCVHQERLEVPCGNQNGETAAFKTVPGIDYKILVSGVNPEDVGAFALKVVEYPKPRNSQCEAAVGLFRKGTTQGTNINADESAPCGRDPVWLGAWFSVFGSGELFTMSTCFRQTRFPTRIYVQEACNAETCIKALDVTELDDECTQYPNGNKVQWQTVLGQEYHVFVQGVQLTDIGMFMLEWAEIRRPDNDRCTRAKPAVRGVNRVNRGSILGATYDPHLCHNSTSLASQTRAGVWFNVQGTGGLMTASTCRRRTEFKTTVSVQVGCAGGLTCIPLEDTIVPCWNPNGMSVTWQSSATESYRIHVAGVTAQDLGEFAMTIVDLDDLDAYRLPNDRCDGPTSADFELQVNSDETLIGTTVGAWDGNYCDGTFNVVTGRHEQAPGVYYQVNGTGNIMTVSTCHPRTDFNAKLYVQDDCNSHVCLEIPKPVYVPDCPDNRFAITKTFVSEINELYHVFVSGATEGASESGQFGINIVDFETPGNDICIQAKALPASTGTLTGTTIAAGVDVTCAGQPHAGNSPGVFYAVSGSGEVLTVTTCFEETDFATEITVLETCNAAECPTSLQIIEPAFVPDCIFDNGATITWVAKEATTYQVMVSGLTDQDVGDFVVESIDYEVPFNDICPEASTLYVRDRPAVGTTANALQDYDTCDSEDSKGRTRSGIWYTVKGTGNLMVATTCDDVTNYNSKIVVQKACDTSEDFEDACALLVDVPVYVPTCDNPKAATVAWESESGQPYQILITGNNAKDIGDFAVSIDDYRKPLNDACDPETTPTLQTNPDDPTEGTTIAATPEVPCGTVKQKTGVWYRVVGSGSLMTVSTCGRRTDFRTKISVQFQAGCRATTCVEESEQDVACENPLGDTFSFQSVDQDVYWIFIAGVGPSDFGDFDIEVLDHGVPDNDKCSEADELVIGGPIQNGTTSGAKRDYFCDDVDDLSPPSVWYSVEGTGNLMTVSTCNELTTTFFTKISIKEGCGAKKDCIKPEDINLPCNRYAHGSQVTFNSKKNTVYKIQVTSLAEFVSGEFGISVVDRPAPANDVCTKGEEIEVNSPGVILGTNIAAQLNDWCGGEKTWPGVYYKVFGTGLMLEASTCHQETTFPTDIAIQPACKEFCVASMAPAEYPCANGNGKVVRWDTTLNERYIVFVTGGTRTDIGDFGLTVIGHSVPENDECENANALVVNGPSTNGTLIAANPDPPCPGDDPKYPGVWYTLIGTGNLMTVTTCDETTDVTTRIAVHTGSCSTEAPGECVELDDKLKIDCPFNAGSFATFMSVEDEPYHILVTGADFTTVGSFMVSAYDYLPPDNDVCTDATALTIDNPDGPAIGTNVASTFDIGCDADGDSLEYDAGIWYMVAGTGMLMTVSTCAQETDYETQLSVQRRCKEGFCTEVLDPVFVPKCTNPFGDTLTFKSIDGEAYFFLVSPANDTNMFGTVGVSITQYIPPENDECKEAIDLEVNSGLLENGTTIAATLDGPCGGPKERTGVWYKVIGTGELLAASTCSARTDFETDIIVQKGNCDSDECPELKPVKLPCLNGKSSTAIWQSEPGKAYRLLVTGVDETQVGDFDIFVDEFFAPLNDYCVNAFDMPNNGEVVLGTTIASLPDVEDAACAEEPPQSAGVFYRVTGTGRILSVSTCTEFTNFATVLTVQGTCNKTDTCTPKINAGLNCDNPLGSTYTWQSEPGAKYLIHVAAVEPDAVGDFGVFVKDHSVQFNDKCSTAKSLTVDARRPTRSSTVGASTDLWCGGDGTPDTRGWPGTWFKATGTGGPMIVSTCDEATSFRTDVGIKRDTCDGKCLSEVDSAPCPNGNINGKLLRFDSVLGIPYSIFVTGLDLDMFGDFAIQVLSAPDPTGAICKSAVPLVIGITPAIGSTVGSERWGWCGGPSDWRGEWFVFTGSGDLMTISTCTEETDFDHDFSVQTTCDGSDTCITQPALPAENCTGISEFGRELVLSTEVDQVYYVFITGRQLSDVGNFGIFVEDNRVDTQLIGKCLRFLKGECKCDGYRKCVSLRVRNDSCEYTEAPAIAQLERDTVKARAFKHFDKKCGTGNRMRNDNMRATTPTMRRKRKRRKLL